jgi:phage terminase large subunit-like protein
MCGGRDQMAKESPLCGYFEVYDTEITFADGRPGRIFRIAAVAGTNEGGLPTLFVRDELHEWGEPGSRKARVATVVGKSTRKRRTPHGSGRIISLSTAGFDVDHSFLGDLYKLGKRVEHNPAVSPRFLMDWREAPDGLDYKLAKHRERAVLAASGAAGVLWNVADRVNDWGKPAYPSHEWIRYYANRWVDVAEESWLKDHPGAWAACRGTWVSDPANPFVVVVDMALRRDSVAVSRLEKLPDERIAIKTRIWRPDDGPIDHLDVFNHVREIARGPGFRGVVYDPRFFELPGRMLEDEGILVIQFDQTPQRMAPACGLAFDLIVGRKIVHDGDPDLADHVKAAVKREQERGFTLSKGRSRRHIDATITLCMGVWVLNEVPEASQQFFGSWR